MTSRQIGHKSGTIAAQRRTPARRRVGGGTRQSGGKKDAPLTPVEKRRTIQLLACGGIFIFLVAVKLLLPAKMVQLDQKLTGLLEQNMDVRAVFSAVGEAVSGENDVDGALEDVFQAVFHPQDPSAVEVVALTGGEALFGETAAIGSLRDFRLGTGTSTDWLPAEPTAAAADMGTAAVESQEAATQEGTEAKEGLVQTEASSLAYVLYSDQNLPENVSLEQAILGFDYCTPVFGTLSSNFGYRQHPVEGEERFHYGLDIAADTGTSVGCFADGTVKAVGESSSYGKYCIVSHPGGYDTLYAHCSRITTSSGTSVKEGEKIAEVGETGMATGPHLHFELHRDGVYLNPIYYVETA